MATVEHAPLVPTLYDDILTLFALSGTGSMPTHLVNYGRVMRNWFGPQGIRRIIPSFAVLCATTSSRESPNRLPTLKTHTLSSTPPLQQPSSSNVASKPTLALTKNLNSDSVTMLKWRLLERAVLPITSYSSFLNSAICHSIGRTLAWALQFHKFTHTRKTGGFHCLSTRYRFSHPRCGRLCGADGRAQVHC